MAGTPRICPGCRSLDGAHTFDETCTLDKEPDYVTLRVKRALVLIGLPGTDEVHLTLDMPTPFPELNYDGTAKIAVRKGYGVEWCKTVLLIQPEVIQGGG